jgi:hypothetical protein
MTVPTDRKTDPNNLPYTYLKGAQRVEYLTQTIVPEGFNGLGLFYYYEVIIPHLANYQHLHFRARESLLFQLGHPISFLYGQYLFPSFRRMESLFCYYLSVHFYG